MLSSFARPGSGYSIWHSALGSSYRGGWLTVKLRTRLLPILAIPCAQSHVVGFGASNNNRGRNRIAARLKSPATVCETRLRYTELAWEVTISRILAGQRRPRLKPSD